MMEVFDALPVRQGEGSMATNIRVMFIGHGPSGLPEDRVVNTFHFIGGPPYAESVVSALDQVQAFYITPAGSFNPLSIYLSPWISTSAELRAYNMDLLPKERPPTIRPITITTIGSSGYAEEVACCLSYLGGGIVNPRNRGRIYFGPLSTTAVTAASTTLPARPATQFINTLLACGTRMALPSAPVAWAIRSTRPAVNYKIITHGYVDDALDTQERRGPKTTQRFPFTIEGI